jgi:flagellar FliJ protein
MAFKFRLQRVLELREQAEQARARALASAQNAAAQARQAQETLEALHQTSRTQLQAATIAAPRVGHLQQLGTTLGALEVRLEQATEVVQAAEADVQQARQQLEEAARNRRVLTRLRERHVESWRAEEVLKDRVQMDEVALARFGRRTGAPTDPSTDSKA